MGDYQLNLASKGISLLSGLVTSIILARYLGVALRGDFAFLTQTSSMVAIALGLGIAQAFPYYFKRTPSETTFKLFLRIFLLQFAIYGAGVGVATALIDNTFIRCLLILTVVTVLYQQLESSMAAYRIRLKIWVNVALSLTRILAYIAMFLWLQVSLVWPVLIAIVLWLGAACCYVVAAGRQTVRVPFSTAREIVAYSWMLMVSTLLVVMNYNIDTLMLKWLGTPEDLGNYAVAAGIIIYLWVVPDAIKEVLVSRVVRSDDPRTVLLPLKVALASGLVGVLVLLLAGPSVIPLVFGEEFSSAAELGSILSIGVISMIYFKILGVAVLAGGHRRIYFITLSVSVFLNVLLNFFAIPAGGAVGAAWVCVGSYSVTGGVFVVYFCRMYRLRVRDMFWLNRDEIRAIVKMRG